MMDKINWLRSLPYPEYTAGKLIKPPHPCLLKVGQLFHQSVIITSCNCDYNGPWNEDLLPLLIKVSLTMQEVNEHAFDLYDVRAGKDRYGRRPLIKRTLGGDTSYYRSKK